MEIMLRDNRTRRHMQTKYTDARGPDGALAHSCRNLWPDRAGQTPVTNVCCSQSRVLVHELQCCTCALFLLFTPEIFHPWYLGLIFCMVFPHTPLTYSSFGIIKPPPNLVSASPSPTTANISTNILVLIFIKLVLCIMLHYRDSMY